MKFTKGIVGIEEFKALSSMCRDPTSYEKLGNTILDALDKGEVTQ